ncbi:dihydroneopterin aldolase [Flavihumibacter petaseus]|uniref:Putative dihydroneopterin aldolase n=1 Tax=Flavihumibacter petaseus NBRC 106054 TaxID=1220578 RepID=A0A0E9N3L4_9BACT|nr:dihydroneopterin aldolase [Flavihumibacter petaseus]GAO44572.1 putative dihydroneopterin aldolase [Flavihumibacter petaseus NBRC 106054]
MLLTVHLHKLVFHAAHGLYEGEDKVGNDFEVNVDIEYTVKKDKVHDIRNLISYEDVLQIVRQRMNIPTPLLEELAFSIIQKIRHRYASVRVVRLSIYKLNAPLANFQGKVGITLQQEFDR